MTLNDVRLYSQYGSVAGSKFKNILAKGAVSDGNDAWVTDSIVSTPNNVLIRAVVDLSTVDKGISKLITFRGNTYAMECSVRED